VTELVEVLMLWFLQTQPPRAPVTELVEVRSPHQADKGERCNYERGQIKKSYRPKAEGFFRINLLIFIRESLS
jgi:hypothetical protein